MVKNANNKNLNLMVFPEFKDAYDKMLEERGIKNRSEHILSLILADAQAHGYKLPPAAAPHGVRSDALPQGWKSRFYPDRYQIVAVWNGKEFEFSHLHETERFDSDRVLDTLRADEVIPGDGRKVEVTVLDVPETVNKEKLQQGIRLELMTWFSENQM